MRNLIFLILLSLSIHSSAQIVRNDNLNVSLSSYNSTFKVVVLDVESLSPCDSLLVKFRWPSYPDSIIKFHKGYKGQIMLPSDGGNISILFKTVSSCNIQSNGPWTTLSLVALSIRDNIGVQRPPKPGAVEYVRIVAIDGSSSITLSESDFQKKRSLYRLHYFIFRPGKPKEIIL